MRKCDLPQAGSRVSSRAAEMGPRLLSVSLLVLLPPLPAWSTPWTPCCVHGLAFCARSPWTPHPAPLCKGGERGTVSGVMSHRLQAASGAAPKQRHPFEKGTLQRSKHVPRTCLEWVLLLPLNWRAWALLAKPVNIFVHLFIWELSHSSCLALDKTNWCYNRLLNSYLSSSFEK